MKTVNFIQRYPRVILTFIIILLGLTIYLCLRNHQLGRKLSRYEPELRYSSTATIRHDGEVSRINFYTTKDEFTLVPEYSGKLIPSRILYWNSQPTKSDPKNAYGSSMKDSLVQFIFDKKVLELSFYDKDLQEYVTSSYNLDFERYKYNWTSQGLTYQKKFSLEVLPYVQVGYGYFNKAINLGTGISIKTRKIDYDIGINLTNYQGTEYKLKPDLEISVKYKFDKWLK